MKSENIEEKSTSKPERWSWHIEECVRSRADRPYSSEEQNETEEPSGINKPIRRLLIETEVTNGRIGC